MKSLQHELHDVKKKLSENRIEVGIHQLRNLIDGLPKTDERENIENGIILLSSRFFELVANRQRGMLSSEEFNKEKSNIVDSLLQISISVEHIINEAPDNSIKGLSKSLVRRLLTSRRFWLVVGLLICAIAFFNRQYLSILYNTFTDTKGELIVLDNAAFEAKVSDLHSAIEVADARQIGKDTSIYKSWVASQLITSLLGPNTSAYDAAYLEVVAREVRQKGCNWPEIKEYDDYRASAWAVSTLGRLGAINKLPCDPMQFFVTSQLVDGSWSIVKIDPKLKEYGSTYATCLVLLALHGNVNDPSLSPATKEALNKAISRGITWLLETRSKKDNHKAVWLDYPNTSEMLKLESKSLSALAIHTLNVLGAATPSLNQLWLKNLDLSESKFRNLYDREQTDVFYRVDGVDYFHDATRHMILPWEIVATVDAYKDGSISQRIHANRWLNDLIPTINITESKTYPNFMRAEMLIGLRYLAEPDYRGRVNCLKK